MKKQLLTGSILSLFLPLFASAQCNPATALVGQTWAYHIDHPYTAAIGVFTAQPGGTVTMTQTSVGYVTSAPSVPQLQRTATGGGRWMSNADCTGGMLLLNTRGRAYQLTYAITPGDPASMTLTGRDEALFPNFVLALVQPQIVFGCVGGKPQILQPGCMGPGPVGRISENDYINVSGGARRDPPKACPAGLTNPLRLLDGARYDYFLMQGKLAGVQTGSTETGRMELSFPNPAAYSGNLNVFNRMFVDLDRNGNPTQSSPMSRYPDPGRYVVYPDCSGGEFLINGRTFPLHAEFVFSKADFSEVFLILDYTPELPLPVPYFGVGVRP